MSKPTPPGKDFNYLNQPTPLLYICGHMCADGTALYGKPEDKDKNKKPVLSDLAREGCIAIVFPCGECYDSQAWVYEKTMRKWVKAPVFRAQQQQQVEKKKKQQQQLEKKKKQAAKHAQLEREIQELEKEKQFLLEQLEKMKSLPK
ncbi:hypothetical protein N0V85_008613 [Neurospora sp. IMI 360204]|nr:hypothetical protein N0V85_008613 [Neurospora sp. IMI 360204]